MSKRQKVPEGSVWQLRGVKSGTVLHDGITATSAPELLHGKTERPLDEVRPGSSTLIELDGAYPMLFDLARVG